jgi:transcriptional regulator with XRE-family HTH domain
MPSVTERWREAVSEIVAAAKIRQNKIADDLGVSHVVVARFLSGARRPSPDSVLRINRAVGKLAKHPNVEPYLDCEALLCHLLDVEHLDVDALFDGAVYTLDHYQQFFKPGYRDRIEDFVRAHDDRANKKLVVELNRAYSRVLIAELKVASAPVGFATIYNALERSGVDVPALLSHNGAKQLARERFEWIVRKELADANPSRPASVRLEAERRIFRALDATFVVASGEALTAARALIDTLKRKEGHS